MNITETVEGLERYPVNLRYPRDLRDDLETLKRVLIPTPTGVQIPLSLVSSIDYRIGPPVIKSEDARPNAWIYVYISTSDIGGFVMQAKEVISNKGNIPAGYTLTWTGQFEYMERAAKRLSIVAPATLFIIFLLLYFINMAKVRFSGSERMQPGAGDFDAEMNTITASGGRSPAGLPEINSPPRLTWFDSARNKLKSLLGK